MRLADAFFNNETDYCAAFYCGYGEDSEYSFGYLQKTYLPESNSFAVDTSKTPGNISDWNYLVQYLAGGTWNVGASQMPESIERLAAMQGFTDYKHKLATSGVNVWRESGAEHMLPYAVDSFPTILYASAELTQQITDLTTVIEPYAQEQIALFITGKRDLSETDDFAGELKSLGMDQLLEIYTEQYNEYINK